MKRFCLFYDYRLKRMQTSYPEMINDVIRIMGSPSVKNYVKEGHDITEVHFFWTDITSRKSLYVVSDRKMHITAITITKRNRKTVDLMSTKNINYK